MGDAGANHSPREHYCGLDERGCTPETCRNTRMIALNKDLAAWYRARARNQDVSAAGAEEE